MANNTSTATKGAVAAKLFSLSNIYIWIAFFILCLIFLIGPFFAVFTNQTPGGGAISGVGVEEIPPEYLVIYQQAEKQYNVPWNLLAAVHKVETDFGRISPMVSPVGALGHMQFMCRTWVGWSIPGTRLGACDSSVNYTDLSLIKRNGGYGVDGNQDGKADPFNPYDAIFSAAKYLASNGASNGRLEEALMAYNHSSEYVQKVMGYAVMYVDNSSGSMVSESGMSWPVPCTRNVTSPFGQRLHPISKTWEMHNGIDIAQAGCNSSPIVSAATGKVTFSGTMGGYGIVVFVDHGDGVQTRYAHLQGSTVYVGQTVQRGQIVGLLGTTGNSTGPHLHYEVRLRSNPYDPLKFYQ